MSRRKNTEETLKKEFGGRIEALTRNWENKAAELYKNEVQKRPRPNMLKSQPSTTQMPSILQIKPKTIPTNPSKVVINSSPGNIMIDDNCIGLEKEVLELRKKKHMLTLSLMSLRTFEQLI